MAWSNGPLVLYHGTTQRYAKAIQKGGVDLDRCAKATEFGQGFYMTPNLPQAMRHATRIFREQRALAKRGGLDPWLPTVLEYQVRRVDLMMLTALWFATPTADWTDFVNHCLRGLPHMNSTPGFYDVVSGPIRNNRQTVEPRPLEQVSFHTEQSVGLLKNAYIIAMGP